MANSQKRTGEGLIEQTLSRQAGFQQRINEHVAFQINNLTELRKIIPEKGFHESERLIDQIETDSNFASSNRFFFEMMDVITKVAVAFHNMRSSAPEDL